MSVEKAKEFVEKFYSDDEFMAKIIKESRMFRLAGEGADKISDQEQHEKIAEAARNNGYDITSEEYASANKEYVDKLGGWKGIKMAFHIVKIAKKVRKEAEK